MGNTKTHCFLGEHQNALFPFGVPSKPSNKRGSKSHFEKPHGFHSTANITTCSLTKLTFGFNLCSFLRTGPFPLDHRHLSVITVKPSKACGFRFEPAECQRHLAEASRARTGGSVAFERARRHCELRIHIDIYGSVYVI